MTTSFSTELVSSLEVLEQLQAEWNDLVDNMDRPEIFYRWEWNFHFYRRCRHEEDLFVVLVRDRASGRLVGVAPLCLRRFRRFGIAIRVVEPIVADVADYQNFLVRSHVHRGKVVTAILNFFEDRAASWDVIDLCQFCTRDPTTFQIITNGQLRHDWTVRTHIETAVASRDLRPGRAVEDEGRLRRVRNRMTSLRRRGLELKLNPGDLVERWRIFCELHRRAWTDSPLNDERYRLFFTDLIASDGMKDRSEIALAYLDGRVAAVHFGFVSWDKVFFYMPAMDRSFSRERVGAVLLYALVEHHAKTRTTFDFMRTVPKYKSWYTDWLDANMRIVIHRNAGLAAFAFGLHDVARRFLVELGFPRAILRRLTGQSRKGV